MKFRAFLFALTFTVMFFLPMTAAFGVPSPDEAKPLLEETPSASPEKTAETKEEKTTPALPVFRIFDVSAEVIREVPAK